MTKMFEGKVALVTGASRGIGAATAQALALQGAHVIITARTAKDLEAVEDAIFAAGGSATIAPLDLTDGDSIARLAAAVTERLIAVTSSVGATPRAFWGAYGASKAALENLVQSYGEEVKNLSGVRTAIVDPGRTRTKMRAAAYPGEDPASVKEPSVVADAIIELLQSEFETGHRLAIKA